MPVIGSTDLCAFKQRIPKFIVIWILKWTIEKNFYSLYADAVLYIPDLQALLSHWPHYVNPELDRLRRDDSRSTYQP